MNYFCWEKDQFNQWAPVLYHGEHPDVIKPLSKERKGDRSKVWPVEEDVTLDQASTYPKPITSEEIDDSP